MLPILTSSEMRSCDERAIGEFGISSISLMEAAARGAAKALEARVKLKHKSVLILCGKGNNGGDGFALARYLIKRDARVTIALFGSPADLRGDARANYRKAAERGIPVIVNPAAILVSSGKWDVIVDAILGTGAKLPLHKNMTDIIEAANACPCFKFSIDAPTGIETDNGVKPGAAFRADATATMAARKPGLCLGDGKKYAGDITVIDIGTPSALLIPEQYSLRFPERDDIIARIPKREADANKYSVGKLFLLCGSRGMTGAAVMASRAAMRSGAGIAVLGVPKSQQDVVAVRLTEVMTTPIVEAKGCINDPELKSLAAFSSWGNANVIGCGVSRNTGAADTVRNFIKAAQSPCVLDADGLIAFTGKLEELAASPQPLILTPHHGELAHLIGMERQEIDANPIAAAKNVAKRLRCIMVLKGAPTVIATPEGIAYINPTGNPGMATAGSGDVLAGVIGALLAQGVSPIDAALCGVYMHGLAGDIAEAQFSTHGMIATDIIECLPDAWNALFSQS